MIWAACAVFLSAFLLFEAELMISRALLPSYGGSCVVWGTAMVFFQLVLLLGYAWSSVARWRFQARSYALFHIAAVAVSAVLLPLNTMTSGFGGIGIVSVLAWLVQSVGMPAFLLSTTSVLTQWWWMESQEGRPEKAYILYAASNAGSIAGLLAYPFVVEPSLDAAAQQKLWRCAYAILPLFLFLSRPPRASEKFPACVVKPNAALRWRNILLWFAPSAAGGAVLLATTNMITLDVASAPLLWAVPLSVYLVTWALAFGTHDAVPAYAKTSFKWACVVGWLLYLMSLMRFSPPVLAAVVLYCAVLFLVCRHCHGLVAYLKPLNAALMPFFYLAIAAGGLFGSMVVAWLTPLLVPWLVEYPMSLFMAALAVSVSEVDRSRNEKPVAGMWLPSLAACTGVVVALVIVPAVVGRIVSFGETGSRLCFIVAAVPLSLAILGASKRPRLLPVALLAALSASFFTSDIALQARTIHRARSYYGIFVVFERGPLRYLQQGAVQHGRQYLDPDVRDAPLSYYHLSTPAAEIMQSGSLWRRGIARRVGMIGLGTGALAAYLSRGDEMTIYELDSKNIAVAEKYFSYLSSARSRGAKISFVTGDGRASLRAQPAGAHDLLIVDAFSSGSVPMHLLTVEALREYVRTLASGGLVLVHVSNRYLDLTHLVLSCVSAAGYYGCAKDNAKNPHPDADVSYWVAFSSDRQVVQRLVSEFGWSEPPAERRLPRPWTDGRNAIVELLAWGHSGSIRRSE